MAPSAFKPYESDVEAQRATKIDTEHSYRPAFQRLVESFETGLSAVNDPKRTEETGAPDFVVLRSPGLIVGHIETKTLNTSLDACERTEQIQRYREGLENFILTDYLTFRWYVLGEKQREVVLGAEAGGTFRWHRSAEKDLTDLFTAFLAHSPQKIEQADHLARRLASLTHLLRDSVFRTLDTKAASTTVLDLQKAFHEVLIPDMTLPDFADMFAQTLAYGLLAARVQHTGKTPFRRQDAARQIPRSNPFLRRLFDAVTGVALDDEPFVLIVDDIAQMLDNTDIDKVLADFGKLTGKDDPIVYFYELFLEVYNPDLRGKRGVYYTPIQVVRYIVRSVDALLRSEFALRDGLSDTAMIEYQLPPEKEQQEPEKKTAPRVLVLDPACGTGTFLYAVVEHARAEAKASGNAGRWCPFVQEQLLPRLFGFELLMAPYAIAHLKLELQLSGLDLPPSDRPTWSCQLQRDERINVFLTNSLEPAVPKSTVLLGQYITDEAESAAHVKGDMPIMVVLGNPPYKGQSANRTFTEEVVLKGRRKVKVKTPTFIGRLMEDYYFCDGKRIPEQNPKWIQNDYVKFLRFGQWRIERSGSGVLAFITASSYLDSPTFNGVRQHLLDTFSDIYILDLHGSARRREASGRSGRDQNVFEISEGVAIGLFVRRPGATGRGRVHYAEVWDELQPKLDWLDSHSIDTTTWTDVQPVAPLYLFVRADAATDAIWQRGMSLPDAMPLHGAGVVTSRDGLVVDPDKGVLEKRIAAFLDPKLKDDDARLKFFGPSKPDDPYPAGDNRDWKLPQKRRLLRSDKKWRDHLELVMYRPFDTEWMLYHQHAVDFPRHDVMGNLTDCKNVALITGRTNKSGRGDHFFCTSVPAEAKSAESTTQSHVFPLLLCRSTAVKDQLTAFDDQTAPSVRRVNLSPEFLSALKTRTGLDFDLSGAGGPGVITPEEVFDFIYGEFYSSEYRRLFGQQMKSEFPRVLLPSDAPTLKAIAAHGEFLRHLHLLDPAAVGKSPVRFAKRGSNLVQSPTYRGRGELELGTKTPLAEGRVYINRRDGQYFADVPREVWLFTVGGYRVLWKWLDKRDGRALSAVDIDGFAAIATAIEKTIAEVARLDATIAVAGGWSAISM